MLIGHMWNSDCREKHASARDNLKFLKLAFSTVLVVVPIFSHVRCRCIPFASLNEVEHLSQCTTSTETHRNERPWKEGTVWNLDYWQADSLNLTWNDLSASSCYIHPCALFGHICVYWTGFVKGLEPLLVFIESKRRNSPASKRSMPLTRRAVNRCRGESL